MIICGIPERLQDLRYRFIRIRMSGDKSHKAPKDKDFISHNNFPWDHPTLQHYIADGNNYGVLCGNGNLYVIDADTDVLTTYIINKLPETFTVQTTRGYHFYYEVEEYFNTQNFAHFGSIIGIGGYVVGPGSTSSDGSPYTIADNIPITHIDKELFEKTLEPFVLVTNPDKSIDEPEEPTFSCHNYPITQAIIGKHKYRYQCNQTLRNPTAPGPERYACVKTLFYFTRWDDLEMFNFIRNNNRWTNFNWEKTEYQIKQIYKTIIFNSPGREQKQRVGGVK